MDISNAKCPECGRRMVLDRATCPDCGISIQAVFEPSPLARLAPEDQVFVIEFLRHHGSIKKMEQIFGISYPTVKNRLNAIIEAIGGQFEAPRTPSEVLRLLAEGKIGFEEALKELDR